MSANQACPCGSGSAYDACCGPLVRNESQATGVEQLMRSRYSAFVVGDEDHLFRTWHPRTRPEQVAPEPGLEWTGLEVLDVEEPGDGTGVVEFRAHWRWQGKHGLLHERSTFEQRGGRWLYVDGTSPRLG
ncbi:zinc chelation protein SecC [Nocardioides marmorisolisilvae]|uniref:UPF0225 protein EFL95_14335 n=2 Tax=Nocardioides marmorisolisilvae TaxID=1542737 RepID=A0A3N0DY44_9ACTN|nr:zinc chelation protein SecC [Nocardioides marmorisolisilvae]